MIVYPTEQHIAVLATNMQGQHQANVVIEPKTGAYLEYRHLIIGPTRAIWKIISEMKYDN